LAFNIRYRSLHADCNKQNLLQIIVIVSDVLLIFGVRTDGQQLLFSDNAQLCMLLIS
jgi:hypothetical protein